MATNRAESIDVNGKQYKMSYIIVNPDTKQFYNKKQDKFINNMSAASTAKFASWALDNIDNKSDKQVDGLVSMATYRDDKNRIHPINLAKQYDAKSRTMNNVDANLIFGDTVDLTPSPYDKINHSYGNLEVVDNHHYSDLKSLHETERKVSDFNYEDTNKKTLDKPIDGDFQGDSYGYVEMKDNQTNTKPHSDGQHRHEQLSLDLSGLDTKNNKNDLHQ